MKNTVSNEKMKKSSTEPRFYFCFPFEGSRYTRCDFEEDFCDMTQSPEMTSGWVRTNQAPGLKHDHMGRYPGEPLKPDLQNQEKA